MTQGWLALSLTSLGALGVTTALSLRPARIVGRTVASGPPAALARTILYYRDPMHPTYTSDQPGKAPDCGMDLEPVYAAPPVGSGAGESAAPPGLLRVTPPQQKTIGMRVEQVERSRADDAVRTLGRVVPAEDRVFPVVAAADGWIVDIPPHATSGSAVKDGQPLAVVYGRDYGTAQRTFLYTLRALENPPPRVEGDPQDQLAQAVEEARLVLRSLGFGAAAIEQLTAVRQPQLRVTLTAPAAGVIVSRSVFPRQKVERGAELFRIANLDRVWITADLSGDDAAAITQHRGAVRLSIPGQSAVMRSATISDARPVSEGGFRASRVRLEADNRDIALRPNMVVDLEFAISRPEATTVPADAVIESGLHQTVFVRRGEDLFEARAVETGWRSGGRVQIVRGLTAGESIVVAGAFLLDSETRIRRLDPAARD